MPMTKNSSLISRALAPLLVVVQMLGGAVLAAAQDAQIKVNIGTESGRGAAWYQTWWVWVLIGLFALIVIIAITQRGRTVVKG